VKDIVAAPVSRAWSNKVTFDFVQDWLDSMLAFIHAARVCEEQKFWKLASSLTFFQQVGMELRAEC
jgi:hypothetical protein